MATELSVEPSSTSSSSESVQVWACTLANASARNSAPFKNDISTDTRGAGKAGSGLTQLRVKK